MFCCHKYRERAQPELKTVKNPGHKKALSHCNGQGLNFFRRFPKWEERASTF
jgi:hypothetical protein